MSSPLVMSASSCAVRPAFWLAVAVVPSLLVTTMAPVREGCVVWTPLGATVTRVRSSRDCLSLDKVLGTSHTPGWTESPSRTLRRHRHALQPDDVGLPLRRRRRTAGLRRGEGAAPPHISTDLFPRPGQGRRARPPRPTGGADAPAVRPPPDQRRHPRPLSRHH